MADVQVATRPASAIKPIALTHGTLECFSIPESRRFYEEVLGLECVRTSPISLVVRHTTNFHVVCVQVGQDVHENVMLNHWGIDVASKQEVNAAHEFVVKNKDKYKIREVTEPQDQHGSYSFYIEDLDMNWWEVEYYDGWMHDEVFAFGDRVTE